MRRHMPPMPPSCPPLTGCPGPREFTSSLKSTLLRCENLYLQGQSMQSTLQLGRPRCGTAPMSSFWRKAIWKKQSLTSSKQSSLQGTIPSHNGTSKWRQGRARLDAHKRRRRQHITANRPCIPDWTQAALLASPPPTHFSNASSVLATYWESQACGHTIQGAMRRWGDGAMGVGGQSWARAGS